MKTAQETVQSVLEWLMAGEELQEVDFVPSYQSKSFAVPVKKPVAAVGGHSIFVRAEGKSSEIQAIQEKGVEIAVDVYVPVLEGGAACVQLLDKISARLLEDVQEGRYEIKTGTVQYQSNTGAFTAQLLLTITQIQASQQEADKRNVIMHVNGVRFYAQNVTVTEIDDLYPIECYGEKTPYASINRGQRFEVVIQKPVAKDNLSEAFTQANATVSVRNAGGSIYLYGCNVKRIESHVENGLYYMDTILLTAERKVTV